MLKLQIKYEDAGGLVPWEIHIYFITEEGEESDTYKVTCTQKSSDVKTIQPYLFSDARLSQLVTTLPVWSSL